MRWVIVTAVIVAVTAAIAVNALLLLSYGTDHTDPVGTLSPVANLPVQTTTVPTTPVTTTPTGGHGSTGDSADD